MIIKKLVKIISDLFFYEKRHVHAFVIFPAQRDYVLCCRVPFYLLALWKYERVDQPIYPSSTATKISL